MRSLPPSTTEVPGGGAPAGALARCVDGTAADFAAETWARRSKLTRAAQLGRDFADLLSPDAVDELISERGLRTPFLRMAKDGVVQPATSFTRGGGAGAGVTDQAADDRVLGKIADGATLVLQGLHRMWPPLVEFGSRLAAELGHPVQINAYITPPQNQGFAPHYDVHDVFVLQVSGRKRWTIHEPVVTAPLDNQPFEGFRTEIAERTAQPPAIDTVLEPGDALYLPRGTVHAAQALGETSIHLTVGIHPITRYHLVKQLLDAAQDDEALRESLPAGVDLSDPAVLAPHLAATVAALQARLARPDVAAAARAVGTSLMQRTRPSALRPLAQLAAAESLTVDTSIRLRPGLRIRVEGDGDERRLVMLDRTVTLPATLDGSIKTVLAAAPFRPGELADLDEADQLTFVRRLLRDGVVVPAE